MEKIFRSLPSVVKHFVTVLIAVLPLTIVMYSAIKYSSGELTRLEAVILGGLIGLALLIYDAIRDKSRYWDDEDNSRL